MVSPWIAYNSSMESRIKFQNPEKNSPDVEKVLTFYRAISKKLMDLNPIKEYVPIKSIVLGTFRSASGDGTVYTVTKQKNITCTCPGYRFRRKCKHMGMV